IGRTVLRLAFQCGREYFHHFFPTFRSQLHGFWFFISSHRDKNHFSPLHPSQFWIAKLILTPHRASWPDGFNDLNGFFAPEEVEPGLLFGLPQGRSINLSTLDIDT